MLTTFLNIMKPECFKEIKNDYYTTNTNSQGFYSRIARQLDEMDKDTKVSLEQTLNDLPKWNDTLDCVLYLEQ